MKLDPGRKLELTRTHPEIEFLGALAVLMAIGFVAMWTSSSGLAIRKDLGASYFAVKQALILVLALLVFLTAYLIPLDALRSRTGIISILAFVFLLTPFIPGLGVVLNGSRRWIRMGLFNYQPSEIWKIASVFYVAHVLDKRREAIQRSAVEAIFPFIIVCAGVAVIFLQDDFSTSILALGAPLVVFWLAGVPLKFFFAAGLLSIPALAVMVGSSEYRLQRVLGFIIPDFDPHGANFQIQNSLKAIISGGLFGKGLGLGTRKLSSIPEIESDFVFAGFAEEFGFLGVAIVFAIWVFIAFTAIREARKRGGFRELLAIGLIVLLCLQVLANLGVVSGFFPVTGLALPFFSSGGSSLLASCLSCGLIANALKGGNFKALPSDSQEHGGFDA